MSDTNEDIFGRVLQGLRDAAPPEGMESRIVSAVQYRASTAPVKSRPLWRIVPLAGSAVLATALFFTAHRNAPQTTMPHPQAASLRATIRPAIATGSLERAGHRRRPTPALQLKEDSASISYPAPPMPLTEQEKLLLRIIHKDDPVQIAMLDPVQREAMYASERAQVQQFFTPPTPSKQETPSEP